MRAFKRAIKLFSKMLCKKTSWDCSNRRGHKNGWQ